MKDSQRKAMFAKKKKGVSSKEIDVTFKRMNDDIDDYPRLEKQLKKLSDVIKIDSAGYASGNSAVFKIGVQNGISEEQMDYFKKDTDFEILEIEPHDNRFVTITFMDKKHPNKAMFGN